MDEHDLSGLGTRYAAAWSSQDPARLASFYSEEGSLSVNDGQPAIGRTAIAAKAQSFMSAFPDMVVALERMELQGGHAVFRWVWTGANTGPGGTGRFVRITGHEVWTLDQDGLIARSEGHFDEADYQRQLQAGTASSPQLWNAAQYARNARFVADLGAPVVDLLDPKPGESILDLGCGDGALTAGLVKAGCRVIGVDASADMIAAARTLGLDARVMDGQSLPFVGEFDAVFSNAALHWMKQPDQVIAGVWRALKPGGRFVGEMGGHGNVAHIVSALEAALTARRMTVPSPWFFPTPEAYRALLEAGGFEVHQAELIPRPTVLPGDVGAWLETFAQPFTSALPEPDRPALIAELVDALRPALLGADGQWRADYVRLRFSASRALSPS